MKNIEILIKKGLDHHREGRLVAAREIYQSVLQLSPAHYEALRLLGLIESQSGNKEKGLLLIRQAILSNSSIPTAYINEGMLLESIGRVEDAILSYTKAINYKKSAEFYFFRAGALRVLKRFEEAESDLLNCVKINSRYLEAYNNLGLVQRDLKKNKESLVSFDKALEINDRSYEANLNKGMALLDLEEIDQSVIFFKKACEIRPGEAESIVKLGTAYLRNGSYELAVDCFYRSIEIEKNLLEPYGWLINALKKLNRINEAIEITHELIKTKPDEKYLMILAELYLASGKFEEALSIYKDLLNTKNNDPVVLAHCGQVEQMQGNLDKAISYYEKALQLDPEMDRVYYHRSIIHNEYGQEGLAFDDISKAIRINNRNPNYYQIRGNLNLSRANHLEVIEDYQKALEIDPNFKFLEGHLIYVRNKICQWENYELNCSIIKDRIRAGQACSTVFPLHSIIDDLDVHQRAALAWKAHRLDVMASPWRIKKKHNKKITIGYFSSDYRNHPVAMLIKGLLRDHNRNQFIVLAFSLGNDDKSDLREEIIGSVDEFIDLSVEKDSSAVEMARSYNLDIAVDLNGYTHNSRSVIFANRVAPVQVSYLGFLGTMGANFIDYIICDRVMIPDLNSNYFSEKRIILPWYQVNDHKKINNLRKVNKHEYNLTQDEMIYCCFNNTYKLTPRIIDCWAKILSKVGKSKLVLYVSDSIARTNLMNEFSYRNVDFTRLIFAERKDYDEYLERYQAMDLFLDTYPYNGGTTTADALWAGLPVLTLAGESFASRYGASLLTALGMEELIAYTEEEYCIKAVELAFDKDRLGSIKAKLNQARIHSPLFNNKAFVRNIEAAYKAAHFRCQQGLEPATIEVQYDNESINSGSP